MRANRNISGLCIPLWMDIMMNIDRERGFRNKSDLIKNGSFSYCYTYKEINRLIRMGFIRWDGKRFEKNKPIFLTEKGKETQELIFFLINRIR